MDYSNDTDATGGGWQAKLKWSLILIGGPVLLVIGVGGFAAWVGTPEEQFDRMVDSDPTGKPMFVALRKHFPDEYGSFRRTMLPHVERGAKPQELTLISGEFMRGFNERHRWEVARAPAAELRAFMASQLAAFEKAMGCDWDRAALAGAHAPLRRLCEQALSDDPEKRPASAGAVAAALERWARPLPVWPLMAVAAVVFLLALGWWMWPKSAPASAVHPV